MLVLDMHNMASTATMNTPLPESGFTSLDALPDELLLQIFGHLDYPFLLALSRVRTFNLCYGSY